MPNIRFGRIRGGIFFSRGKKKKELEGLIFIIIILFIYQEVFPTCKKKTGGTSFQALSTTNFWHMIGCEERRISKDHHFPWVDHRSCRELTEFGLCGMPGTRSRGKGLDRTLLTSGSRFHPAEAATSAGFPISLRGLFSLSHSLFPGAARGGPRRGWLKSLSQLLRAPGSGNDRIHQRQPKTAFLHGIKTGNGGSAGGTNLVTEGGGMLSRGLN
jgi:hypothetical protein